MEKYNKMGILKMAEEEGVEFIRLQFTDMFGMLKNIAVPASRLVEALDGGCSVEGAALDGFSQEGERLYLKPDLHTFAILPWRPQHGKVARFLCDVCREDGFRCQSDPRSILKKSIERAAAMGYSFQVNPECEFFLFHADENGQPTTLSHERAGYLDTSPIDLGENTRRDIVLTLEEMGYEITSSHHETAPAQHEIDFAFEDALATADKVTTFKMAVRTIAKRYGLHATFMPKPRMGDDGSGMHVNMRLMKDGRGAFSDGSGALGPVGEAFLAGILSHIDGMTAILNPLVNSYKRLVPGFAAPTETAWSRTQRNALLHVRAGKDGGVDLELRSPDSAANPYLVFALCLEAGLDGIKKGLSAPGELKEDVHALSFEGKSRRGIKSLPGNLGDALLAMQEDALIMDVLGETCAAAYQKAKRDEWRDYLGQVTRWELDKYLYLI